MKTRYKVAIGAFALIGLGAHAANGYAGHAGRTGDYCQFGLHLNNSVMHTLNDSSTSWFAGSDALAKGAEKLRARGTAGVDPSVASAGADLATAMVGQALVSSESEIYSAAGTYNATVGRFADACNAVTGQHIGVNT